MQRTETLFTVAFTLGEANDRTLDRLSGFDLEPGVAPLSRQIGAVALLGHDSLESHLFHCLKESATLFHDLTHAISGILPDGIGQPFAPPSQRIIHNGASVQVKTIEHITHRRMFGAGALDGPLRLLLHAMNHVPEIWFSVFFEADNLAIEQR